MESMKSKKTYTLSEATRRMEIYCAYQERCHKEVQKKLKEMGMIPAAQDSILLHLLENNFLNETRFAQAFTRGKFRVKKWGKHRIISELKKRDISQFNIKIALKEISEEEYLQTFQQLFEKRVDQLATEKNLLKKRKKVADYLFYRGWESALVYEALNSIT